MQANEYAKDVKLGENVEDAIFGQLKPPSKDKDANLELSAYELGLSNVK